MTEQETHSTLTRDLRRQAEELARGKAAQSQKKLELLSLKETRQALHELRVHQIELEIQNQELRLKQEKLEAARARYFDLYDMAPVGYATISKEMVITEANLTAATLLGVRRVDLVGRPLSQFIAKEDQGGYYLHIRQLFETGEQQSWALRMVKKDGISIWRRMETTAAQDDDGTTVCRATISDNNAELKQVENALRELKVKVGEEALYHLLVDMTSEGFWLLDKEFMTVYVNRALEDLLGYAKEELLGRSWYDFGDPEWVARAKELEKRRVSGVKEPHPFLFIRKNGSKVLTRIATTPLYDDEGNFNGALGILSDITKQKELEDTLLASEEKYRSLFTYMISGFALLEMIYDDWGNPIDCRYIDVNPAHEKLTGLKKEAIIGRTARESIPDFEDYWIESYGRVEKTGTAEYIENYVEGLNRFYGVLVCRTTPGFVIVTFEDITGRKQAEKDLMELNERLAMALEVGNAGVWEWDLTSDKVRFDDRFHKILGYTPGELPNTLPEWLPYHHPEDIQVWMPKARTYLQGDSAIYESEHRIRNKAGTWSWVFTRGKLVNQSTTGAPGASPEQFIGIAMNITDLKQAEELIQKSNKELIAVNKQLIENQHQLSLSEELFRGLFDNMTSGSAIYTVINDGSKGSYYIIKSFNKMSLKIEGKTLAEIVGRSLYDLRSNIDNYGLIPVLKKVWETGDPEYFSSKIYQDEHFSSYYENFVFKIPSGEVVTIYNDVTENKLAEEKIKASLIEKETMLKEIHHRVKNNLQIISSLLNLQSGYAGDEKMEVIFRACQDRIRAMAGVHELLYRSNNFAEINFGDYIREMTSELFGSYKTGSVDISLVIHVANVMLPIDAAIPCGLIINELFTNALKYAFPGARKGEIKIAMKRTENSVKLLFEDSGIGFLTDADSCKAETFGLKLVHLLVKQLDGSIEQKTGNGTKYVIMFKTETLLGV